MSYAPILRHCNHSGPDSCSGGLCGTYEITIAKGLPRAEPPEILVKMSQLRSPRHFTVSFPPLFLIDYWSSRHQLSYLESSVLPEDVKKTVRSPCKDETADCDEQAAHTDQLPDCSSMDWTCRPRRRLKLGTSRLKARNHASRKETRSWNG